MKNKYIRSLALGMAAMTAFTFTTPQASLLRVEAAAATKATKGTSKITASKKSLSLTAGKSATVQVKLNKKQTKALKITLKSKNAKIAKVAKSSVTVKKGAKAVSFKITAVKAGSTSVVASFKTSTGATKKATVKVNVKAATVALEGVSLNNSTPKVGDVLTASVSPEKASGVKFAWFIGDSAATATNEISGQTGSSLTVTEDMAGKFIKVVATGTSGSASATTTAAVVGTAPAETKVAVTSVSLDKTALKVGDTVNATVAPENATNVSYQWFADGVAIDGATSASFTATEAQLGKKISVKVDGDNNSTATSVETETVASATTNIAVEGLTLDNTTPKVGDTIKVTATPDNATVSKYTWYAYDSTDVANSTKSEIGQGESIKITATMVGKYIGVIATDLEGKDSNPVLTTSSVSEDVSSDVSLLNDFGFQEDGTGIIGDKLRVSYGASFGVPRAITWYRNGSVIDAVTSEIGVTNALTRTISAADGTGSYYVVCVNAEGKSFTTNTVDITDKEDSAKITSFSLEDDYTDGTDIRYNANDNRAVATVKMKKNYAGKIQIYKKSDTAFTSLVDEIETSTGVASETAAMAVSATGTGTKPNDEKAVLTTTMPTNYQVLNVGAAGRLGSGYGYIDNDGSVTYKFVVNDGTLTRGAEYVVAFDQTSIQNDKPGTGTANVYDQAVTVPYVTAPSKLIVKSVSKGNQPIMEFQDANGDKLSWFGYKAGTAADIAIVADPNGVGAATESRLQDCGVDSAKVYKNSTNATDSAKATLLGAEDKGKTVVKGSWTYTTPVAANDTTAFWFAEVKTVKGIFAKDAVTITSEAKGLANDGATDIDITESKTSANSAVVSFSNVRNAGTVYIVRSKYTENNSAVGWDKDKYAAGIPTQLELFNSFKVDDPTTYVGSAQVAAGTDKIEVPNVITPYQHTTTTNGTEMDGNDYIAIFVPEDTSNYGIVYTDGDWSIDSYTSTKDVKSALQIKPEITSFNKDKMTVVAQGGGASKGSITITGLQAKDQFGNDWKDPVAGGARESDNVTVTAIDNTNTFAKEAATGTSSLSNVGVETITVTTETNIDKGDGFKVEVKGLAGLTIVLNADDTISFSASGITFGNTETPNAAADTEFGKKLFTIS